MHRPKGGAPSSVRVPPRRTPSPQVARAVMLQLQDAAFCLRELSNTRCGRPGSTPDLFPSRDTLSAMSRWLRHSFFVVPLVGVVWPPDSWRATLVDRRQWFSCYWRGRRQPRPSLDRRFDTSLGQPVVDYAFLSPSRLAARSSTLTCRASS